MHFGTPGPAMLQNSSNEVTTMDRPTDGRSPQRLSYSGPQRPSVRPPKRRGENLTRCTHAVYLRTGA